MVYEKVGPDMEERDSSGLFDRVQETPGDRWRAGDGEFGYPQFLPRFTDGRDPRKSSRSDNDQSRLSRPGRDGQNKLVRSDALRSSERVHGEQSHAHSIRTAVLSRPLRKQPNSQPAPDRGEVRKPPQPVTRRVIPCQKQTSLQGSSGRGQSEGGAP